MPAYTKSPNYLVRNRYSYCFRMIVPADLRKFVGKKELRYTLRTGYVGLAKSKARLLAGEIQEFFRKLREVISLGDLTDEQIVYMVNRYFRNFINGLEKIRVEPDAFGRGDTFRTVNQITRSVSKGAKKALTDCDYSYVWTNVSDVLKREGLEIEKFSGTYNQICREMLKGMIKFGEIENRRQQGDYSDNLQSIFPLPDDRPAETIDSVAEEKTSESVNNVLEAFWMENAPNWKPRTETQYKTCHRHLHEFLGKNRMLHTVDYEKGREYKKLLSNTITNRGVKMSTGRVDLYLGYAAQVFNWAIKQNYTDLNPFSGLQYGKKRQKRADKQRDAFTPDDLNKMFVESQYFGQDKWGKCKHPHFFWIPLLGLFTGARMEELGQLYVEDVKENEGVWVLDINESRSDQSLKTSEQRIVPLHDFIVNELQFIDYIQSIPQDGRVFPELRRIQNRYTHGFTQWFSKFRKRCGIDTNKTFHSFRHSLTTHLLEKDVPEYRISQLVGHATDSQTTGRYGKRFKPKLLKEKVVDMIDYEINLDHLKNSKFAPR